MNNSNKNLVQVLNELLETNNERTEGFQLASQKTEESDLKELFSDFTASGYQLFHDLVDEMEKLHIKPENNNHNSERRLQTLLNMKNAVLSKDRKSILSSLESGENEALEVYENALKEEALQNSPVAKIIQQQRLEILKSHEQISKIPKS